MKKMLRPYFVLFFLLFVSGCLFQKSGDIVYGVIPTLETQRFDVEGDKADDPCIYIHPTNSELSAFIGTDKGKAGGLRIYDLSGKQIYFAQDGRMNNVDLRYNFMLNSIPVTLIIAGDRTRNTIAIYTIDPESKKLTNVAARRLPLGLTVYGSCMFKSKKTGKYYAFVTGKDGSIEQWELFDNGKGKVDGMLVRYFSLSSQLEGCVADDMLGNLFVGEECRGIWKFKAEPDAGKESILIDSVGKYLVADVEGLTIYYADEKTGYLIASSQGNSTYVIYEREEPHRYAGSFKIIAGNGMEEASGTDGIDVTNAPLGPKFPKGVFIAQSDASQQNQNFKCVPWESIAKKFEPALKINSTWNPRF